MLQRIFVFLFSLLLLPNVSFAWGSGHDDVARLLWEYLPKEVRESFSGAEYSIVLRHCHYPDLPNKTLEQTGEIVGEEDRKLLESFGYSSSDWLHRHRGRAASYILLRKAFREKNPRNAAFYLSVLSHSISDQGAINHTPILQFTTYSKFEGVSYGIRNSCEFSLKNEEVNAKVRERLTRYEPKLLADSFSESVFALIFDSYLQAEVSAEVELAIAFGEKELSNEKMACLVSVQLESLLDMVFSAWTYANCEEEFPMEKFSELTEREDARRRLGKPERDAVFEGLFDEKRNPENPKARIGLVCEPFGSFHIWALSYVGKLLTASTGRTLREHGYAVNAVSFWKMETEPLPDPKEMPILVIFAGHCRISKGIESALRDYVNRGGKLLYAAGSDPKNLTGLADVLKRCGNEEVPVSSKWGIQNEDVFGKMRVTFTSAMPAMGTEPYAFQRNPNFDGFCKPTCLFRIEPKDGVKPLAFLENGKDTFCISAVTSKAAWVPEYLLLPFLFSDLKKISWTELRLDPFAEKVMLGTLEELLRQ